MLLCLVQIIEVTKSLTVYRYSLVFTVILHTPHSLLPWTPPQFMYFRTPVEFTHTAGSLSAGSPAARTIPWIHPTLWWLGYWPRFLCHQLFYDLPPWWTATWCPSANRAPGCWFFFGHTAHFLLHTHIHICTLIYTYTYMNIHSNTHNHIYTYT